MQIATIEHTDVRGNVLLYLKITNDNNNSVLVNIGKKTFDNIKTLTQEEIKIPETLKKEGGKK